MATGVINTQTLSDIADAIRSKSGSSDTFKPSEMAQGILDIPSGGITPTGTVNITSNGTHDVTNYASASVAVPIPSDYTGSYSVTVSADMTIPISGKKATSDISLIYDMTQINEAQTVANQISALVG